MDKELQDNPIFYNFVKKMYDSNCRERREHGQKEFEDVFEYYRKYPKWLYEKYTSIDG